MSGVKRAVFLCSPVEKMSRTEIVNQLTSDYISNFTECLRAVLETTSWNFPSGGVNKVFWGFSKTYSMDSGSLWVADHYSWFERSFVQLSGEGPLHRGGGMCPVHQTAAGQCSRRGSRAKTSSYLHTSVLRWSVQCLLLCVSEGPAARLSRGLTASSYEELSAQHVKVSTQSSGGTRPACQGKQWYVEERFK